MFVAYISNGQLFGINAPTLIFLGLRVGFFELVSFRKDFYKIALWVKKFPPLLFLKGLKSK